MLKEVLLMCENKNFEENSIYFWALLRISLGFIFLWAFLDKLFGLGFSTTKEKAWIYGGSPTYGFLNSVSGPFADFYHAIASSKVVEVLFMLGLLFVGVTLIFGISLRLGTSAGIVMLVLMWTALLPIKTNPLIDDHIVYSVILIAIAHVNSTGVWSFSDWWKSLKMVKNYSFLE